MYQVKGLYNLDVIREKIFFTSDHRFFDYSLIEERDFEDEDKMNDYLIDKWNSVVGKRDVVIHLGNISVEQKSKSEELLKRLNGKIILVIGNHDTHQTTLGIRDKIINTAYKLDIFINDVNITLNHHPQLAWNRKTEGSWMLHGSTLHKDFVNLYEKRLDVGVDGFGGTPLSFEQVNEIMQEKYKHYIKNLNIKGEYL